MLTEFEAACKQAAYYKVLYVKPDIRLFVLLWEMNLISGI